MSTDQMQQFKESGLHFTFQKNWQVCKYDEHRFFQQFSGVGLKGVDFIACCSDQPAYLIEVKNLTQYPQQQDWPQLLEKLSHDIARKVNDSLRGISAISQYYRRKWWYPIAGNFPKGRQFSEWRFWDEVAQKTTITEQFRILLWLETADPPAGWVVDLKRKIRQEIGNPAPKLLITNLQNHVLDSKDLFSAVTRAI